jgi:hypothetical protein
VKDREVDAMRGEREANEAELRQLERALEDANDNVMRLAEDKGDGGLPQLFREMQDVKARLKIEHAARDAAINEVRLAVSALAVKRCSCGAQSLCSLESMFAYVLFRDLNRECA